MTKKGLILINGAGIIDQDYSSAAAIDAIKKDIFVMPFHEIESLLLHEDIVREVLSNIGEEKVEIDNNDKIDQNHQNAGY